MKQVQTSIITLLLVLFLPFSVAHGKEVKDGVTHLTQAEFLEKAEQENIVVIDVRTEGEYQNGFIAGAVNLSHDAIIENISLLDQYKGKDLVFYCHSGVRVKKLTNYLRDVNFTEDEHLFHLKGDIRAWRARGKALVK